MTTEHPEAGDFSGKALLNGMLHVLSDQLEYAREEIFRIDADLYQKHVAHAAAFAMRKLDGMDAATQEQCKASFEAVCAAAKGVMPKAVERLLQAHYMVAAASAEKDRADPAQMLPMMQLSWLVGMAVGQVRDVEFLANQKKRADHGNAGARGGEARRQKYEPFDDWVMNNKDKHRGTPMDKARSMMKVIPVDIAAVTKDPERRIYDLLRGKIQYK